MNEQLLASMAGLVLSLAFAYMPGLSDWYDGKNSQTKALIMAGLLLVVAAASYGLSCTGNFAYFECSEAGAWTAVEVFIAALVANQGTYMITRNIHAEPERATFGNAPE